MTTALLERAETLLDTFTDKIIIRKPTPIRAQTCGGLLQPCCPTAPVCKHDRVCELGLCV
ncbi:hypothetical protein [Nocardia sp. NPDC051570]|uniref:hypothetical protein n=1 Tax=Nocardia sp. NPDC051570 TaxID=3364324 RepID=UPI0037913195